MEAPNFTKKPQSLTKTARLINFALRWLVPLILWLKGVDFKISNEKAIPKKGSVIIVGADHTSLADAIFMMAAYRRPYAGIGMAELVSDEWPWVIRKGFGWLGHIPIVRGNSESGDLASKCAIHALSYGQAIAVWPQGRQVRRGAQTPWYPGFARFAKQTGTKIYVFKLRGAEEFWPTHPDDGGPQPINWQTKVRAGFSDAIDPNDYNTVEELVEAVKHVHAKLTLPN